MHFILKKTWLILFFSIITLLQGCSLHQNNETTAAPVTMSNLVIAEPLPIKFNSEVAIARISALILNPKVTDDQRAQLIFERGVLYDSVGLRSLARFDFSHALKVKPDLVDAYNFLGIHLTQLQEFSQAYENFDAALELQPSHEYAYLNRGIALYYGSRPELAALDFQAFHDKKQDDPYRLLWLYLTEFNVDPIAAERKLRQRATVVDDRMWAKQIIYLYLGDISQDSFVSSLTQGIESHEQLTERLCEAYFYLGKFNQTLGYNNSAANFFKLALSTNVYEFVEHRYAKLELDLMKVQTVINPSELTPVN